ncbi:hypothetical protein ACLOJK_031205 [Asimina triloba]
MASKCCWLKSISDRIVEIERSGMAVDHGCCLPWMAPYEHTWESSMDVMIDGLLSIAKHVDGDLFCYSTVKDFGLHLNYTIDLGAIRLVLVAVLLLVVNRDVNEIGAIKYSSIDRCEFWCGVVLTDVETRTASYTAFYLFSQLVGLLVVVVKFHYYCRAEMGIVVAGRCPCREDDGFATQLNSAMFKPVGWVSYNGGGPLTKRLKDRGNGCSMMITARRHSLATKMRKKVIFIRISWVPIIGTIEEDLPATHRHCHWSSGVGVAGIDP